MLSPNRDIMIVLGNLGFYSCYMRNLHVDSQPLYDLIKIITPFKWTDQHEEHSEEIETRISEDTILAVPSTEYPFHIHVHFSNVRTGCILAQQFPEGKTRVSFNSRVFLYAEQKMSSFQCELCGIVSALQTYEYYILDSLFPIYVYCDHKPTSISGNEKDNYPIGFSKIKSSSPNFTTSKSSGHLDSISPFPT